MRKKDRIKFFNHRVKTIVNTIRVFSVSFFFTYLIIMTFNVYGYFLKYSENVKRLYLSGIIALFFASLVFIYAQKLFYEKNPRFKRKFFYW